MGALIEGVRANLMNQRPKWPSEVWIEANIGMIFRFVLLSMKFEEDLFQFMSPETSEELRDCYNLR